MSTQETPVAPTPRKRAPRKAGPRPPAPNKKGNPLLTQRQERFCQAYVAGDTATAAYRAAYTVVNLKPEKVWTKASELLATGKVRGRIDQLRAEIAVKCAVTVESLSKELDEAREMARKQNHAVALVQATMAKAKLHGMITDKLQAQTTQFVVAAPEVEETTEDWLNSLSN